MTMYTGRGFYSLLILIKEVIKPIPIIFVIYLIYTNGVEFPSVAIGTAVIVSLHCFYNKSSSPIRAYITILVILFFSTILGYELHTIVESIFNDLNLLIATAAAIFTVAQISKQRYISVSDAQKSAEGYKNSISSRISNGDIFTVEAVNGGTIRRIGEYLPYFGSNFSGYILVNIECSSHNVFEVLQLLNQEMDLKYEYVNKNRIEVRVELNRRKIHRVIETVDDIIENECSLNSSDESSKENTIIIIETGHSFISLIGHATGYNYNLIIKNFVFKNSSDLSPITETSNLLLKLKDRPITIKVNNNELPPLSFYYIFDTEFGLLFDYYSDVNKLPYFSVTDGELEIYYLGVSVAVLRQLKRIEETNSVASNIKNVATSIIYNSQREENLPEYVSNYKKYENYDSLPIVYNSTMTLSDNGISDVFIDMINQSMDSKSCMNLQQKTQSSNYSFFRVGYYVYDRKNACVIIYYSPLMDWIGENDRPYFILKIESDGYLDIIVCEDIDYSKLTQIEE